MKLVMSALFGSLLVLALLLPPWRMAWIADGYVPANLARPTTWDGFHRWSYRGGHPTSVTAWDGPSGGGKVTFTGRPKPDFGTWAVLVACAAAGLYFTIRWKVNDDDSRTKLS